MGRFFRQIRALLLYFSIPALGALSPLLVLPAISAHFGTSGWAAVAIGQSLGGAAAIVAELGWGVVGPQRVAATGGSRRIALYRVALSTKLVSTVPIGFVAAVLAFSISQEYKAEAALLAAALSLAALSSNWYFIGSGRPLLVLFSDSVPRISASLIVAASITWLHAPLVTYPLVTLLVAPVALCLSLGVIGGLAFPRWRDFRNAPRAIWRQRVVAAGRAVSTLYTTLPVTLVGIVAPGSVPLFAAVERPMRMALAILAGVPNRLQSWIGRGQNRSERAQRSYRSILYNGLLGLFCGTAFWLGGPLAVHVIFAGTIEVPLHVSALAGVLMAIICLSRGLGLSLVAVSLANHITIAIIVAALAGVVSVATLSSTLGAVGAISGEIIAEVAGVAVQVYLLRRHWAANRRRD